MPELKSKWSGISRPVGNICEKPSHGRTMVCQSVVKLSAGTVIAIAVISPILAEAIGA
jgi:hypothetical protein